jgi:hypothetical protein
MAAQREGSWHEVAGAAHTRSRSAQRRSLKALVRKQTAQQRQVTRARIVLLAAAGWANLAIARKLGIAPNTVCKWRRRFATEGYDGLADRKRSGRPRVFGAAVVAYAKAVACELPATRGVPLGRWSHDATGTGSTLPSTTLTMPAARPARHRRATAPVGAPRPSSSPTTRPANAIPSVFYAAAEPALGIGGPYGAVPGCGR